MDPASPDVGSTDRLGLRFEITDTGIGLAPEARERLFEPFSQADASTTRRYGGTGLGLAISKGLVALFDGEIGVESRPGKGSTFWFTARFAAGTPIVVTPRTDPAVADQPGAAPALVLVVDDNATNQKVAVRMLENLGHRADVAADGAEAVEAWARVPYDLILMDCRMPVMDGYEATQAIRTAEAAGRRTPIVAMTASAMAEDRQRCLDAGMDDFLSKPVQQSDVRQKVNHWLGQRPATGRPIEKAHDPGPVLDDAVASELQSFGREFLTDLVDGFVDSVPERITAVRAAVEAHDAEQLVGSAHVLRGSAANMGGVRVAAACARLEEAAHLGDLAEAASDLLLLEAESALLVSALAALIEVTV
jgi:CheY-like chemotaxis protein/HPt (histidine-containing phosphotransfer) domain-containing protein